MLQPTHAIIHHSLTRDSETVSWSAIRRYHINMQGFRDIGYHYGVELINDFYEVLAGRAENENGAHCIGMNGRSIGVCFVGNYDLVPPPDAMMSHAVRVLGPILCRLQIPIDNVHPHSQYSQKTCPGRLFPMDRLRLALREGYWKV